MASLILLLGCYPIQTRIHADFYLARTPSLALLLCYYRASRREITSHNGTVSCSLALLIESLDFLPVLSYPLVLYA